jgi:hypothetical protein
MAQLLSSGRPTRRAAADAAAKIAVQSQNVSISQLAQVAAAERAAAEAATAAASGGGKAAKGGGGERSKGGGSGRSHKRKQHKGPYVLPLDEVSGSWRLVADDVESVQALGETLTGSDRAADVEMGRLLLQQVVATLLERKQQEEKVRGLGWGPERWASSSSLLHVFLAGPLCRKQQVYPGAG